MHRYYTNTVYIVAVVGVMGSESRLEALIFKMFECFVSLSL